MERTFDRLNALDSFFLETERDESPMHLGAVCFFGEPPSGGRRVTLQRLRTHVEARLERIPRYRQRLMRVPLEGHPVWVDATDFRIEDHLHALSLPAPASPGQMEETVSWIFSRPLSRSRPLWEIWLIEGLARGGFALVCKTHHCLADGLGAIALLTAILGDEPFFVAETPRPWRPRSAPSATDLLRDSLETRARDAASVATSALRHALEQPTDFLEGAKEVWSALRSAAHAAWEPPGTTAFDRPTGSDRRFLWWTVAFDDVKRIGRRLGGTVNETALAIVAEAFAQSAPAMCNGDSIRVYCPVGATQSAASRLQLGNRVSGMFIDLPVGEMSLRRRWETVVAESHRSKGSLSAEGTFLLEGLATSLSPTLLARLEGLVTGGGLFRLVLTNVPGPTSPLYLFDRRMTAVCPFVPLIRGQALGIAIFSYDGMLTWGFHVDASRVDAARELRSAVAAATIRLAKLSDETVSVSRNSAEPIPLHPPRTHPRDRIAVAAG